MMSKDTRQEKISLAMQQLASAGVTRDNKALEDMAAIMVDSAKIMQESSYAPSKADVVDSEVIFTNEELDEMFKDDPTFQEAKRRLAAMQVRDVLGEGSGTASSQTKAGEIDLQRLTRSAVAYAQADKDTKRKAEENRHLEHMEMDKARETVRQALQNPAP